MHWHQFLVWPKESGSQRMCNDWHMVWCWIETLPFLGTQTCEVFNEECNFASSLLFKPIEISFSSFVIFCDYFVPSPQACIPIIIQVLKILGLVIHTSPNLINGPQAFSTRGLI